MSRDWRVGTRLAAAAVAAGSVLSFWAIAPASALPSDRAEAEGRFLEASGGDLDINDIAELKPVYRGDPSNPGIERNNLDATVLDEIDLDLVSPDAGGSKTSDLAGAGVVGQFAKAEKGGIPFASSGAINDDGSIQVAGDDDEGDAEDNAYIDLTDILVDNDLDDIVASARLELGALSATATYEDGEPVGDYQIGDAKLVLDVPLLEDIFGDIDLGDDLLGDVLGGADGGEEGDLLGDVLGGDNGDDEGSLLTAEESKELGELLEGDEGAVKVDLENGEIIVDLEELIKSKGGDYANGLNELPPNTELIDGDLLDAALEGSVNTIGDLLDDLLGEDGLGLSEAIGNEDGDIIGGDDLLGDIDLLNDLFDDISEDILSVKANVQEEPGEFTDPRSGATEDEGDDEGIQLLGLRAPGSFTQRALQITALPGDAGDEPLAQVNLASATVRLGDDGGNADDNADDDTDPEANVDADPDADVDNAADDDADVDAADVDADADDAANVDADADDAADVDAEADSDDDAAADYAAAADGGEGELPNTGSDLSLGLLAGAGALVLAGGATVAIGRIRRNGSAA